jgi:hypothetical protein
LSLILTRYAEEMVRLIDADGSLGLRGADRVIGKEDSTHNQTKSLDVVLGSEEIVLIIDDSPAVTQRHAPSPATPTPHPPAPPPPPPPPATSTNLTRSIRRAVRQAATPRTPGCNPM